MIYVLRSAAFDKNNNFTTLIKIGYTKDDSKKSRFGCYITENPTIQPLSLNAEKMKNGIRTYYNMKYGYDKVSIYFVDVDNKYVPF